MLYTYIIYSIDKALKDIMDTNADMSGKIVIFAGDWRQTLHIATHGSPIMIINRTLTKSYLWPRIQSFSLQKTYECAKLMILANMLKCF